MGEILGYWVGFRCSECVRRQGLISQPEASQGDHEPDNPSGQPEIQPRLSDVGNLVQIQERSFKNGPSRFDDCFPELANAQDTTQHCLQCRFLTQQLFHSYW